MKHSLLLDKVCPVRSLILQEKYADKKRHTSDGESSTMRINLPVTQNGYVFPADQTLISITDLKGRITYCNTNFITVSGYNRAELLGQPHNLIRHPDMPEEAFRDMWETIQGGQPWAGVVKNRRKNGDYYWVRANASPMRDGDRIVGYLSVRTRALDEEIQAADRLYAKMRAEKEAGRLLHVLKHGAVVRNDLFGRIGRLFTLGMRGQFVALVCASAAVPVIATALGAPLWASALAALASAICVAWLLIRKGITPLSGLLDTANLLASGDLTRFFQASGHGQIGKIQLALAQLNVSVRTVVRDVRHEVANLLGSTQEIAAGNQDLSARTDSQASSLEQTAAAMDQINSTIQNASGLAEEGANVARESSTIARHSHEAVQGVVDAMQEITGTSRRIADIISIIEGIAFQTNILALNAAVEAARAGAQGRGFAVVAAEVRSLAQRSADAAKEIKELIQSSVEAVKRGSERADNARSRMDEAMESVGRVTSLLEQINNASKEQAIGVSQINDAVVHLDTITQQNAAMVEELAASASTLNSQVGMVHNTIRVFRLTDKDKTLAEEDAVELRKRSRGDDAVEDNSGRFDAKEAVSDHQQWRVTLRNAINRGLTLDVAQIRRDDCCALGHWLNGPGAQRWGAKPAFSKLVQAHQAFHEAVGRTAELINQQRIADAEATLETSQPLHKAGQDLNRAIHALESEFSRPDAAVPASAHAAQAARPARAAAMPAAPAPPVAATQRAGDDEWETF
jgi:aerotaxis receptor